MSDNSEKKRRFKDKLGDKYRLVILDDDTLGELSSKRFSMIGLFLTIFLSLFGIIALISALIAFTPLKFLIPGYGEIENNKVYMELNEKINLLEKEITTQRVYTEGIKNILNPSASKVKSSGSNLSINGNNLMKGSNNKNISNTYSLDHYYFCCPLKGEVSAEFDLSIKHYGIDVVAAKDTPVKSVLDGVVINADWSTNTGNTISIQHADNIVSVYKHNSVLLKKIGEKVSSCEAIAIIGNTGKLTSGPHVHFELWKNGIAINPIDFIEFNY